MPGGVVKQDAQTALAVRAWNLLGGLDWSGVELVADMLGYDDAELLAEQLAAIRDSMRKK